MKATDAFTKTISDHLQSIAEKDSLFAVSLKKPTKNITDCINYILNTVKDSGRNGFADAEIFGMAVHYYDEDNIPVGKAISGKVVVNHTLGAPKELVANHVSENSPAAKKPAKKQPVAINQSSLF